LESANAILLRKTKLSDTSLIITWCTDVHGKIRTAAKGARRPKSAFAGRLDLFFTDEIQFARSKSGDLHSLREAVLRNPRANIRNNHRSVQMGAYFTGLIDLATEPEQSVPELYDLLRRALDYLDTATPSTRALLHFESELARLSGVLDEKIAPASTLARAFGRLPAGRQELIGQAGD